ncbi:MAG: hypothetical protein LAT51_00360 [Flavobacteriaceae bacterium]|nr:hypothetical protein [Flavobacteriaceae bacterium]
MKKYFLIVLILQLALVSCDPDDAVYSDGNFVAFTDANRSVITALDIDDNFTLDVSIALPVNNETTINLDVEDGTAALGTNFNLPSTVTIPAGETRVTVQGTLLQSDGGNDEEDENVISFSVSLGENTANLPVGIGDAGSRTKTVNIVQVSNCPTPFYEWVGDLNVEDVGEGTSSGTGNLNAGFDCDVLIVDNNLPGIASPSNTNYQLIFTPGPGGSESGTVEIDPTVAREDIELQSGEVVDGVYEGFGFYDSTTGEITINYVFNAVLDGEVLGAFWEGTNVITLVD